MYKYAAGGTTARYLNYQQSGVYMSLTSNKLKFVLIFAVLLLLSVSCERNNPSETANEKIYTPLEQKAFEICGRLDNGDIGSDLKDPAGFYELIDLLFQSEKFKQVANESFPEWLQLEDRVLKDRIWMPWSEPQPAAPFRHIVCGDFYHNPDSRIKWSMIGSGGLHWGPRYEKLVNDKVLCFVRDLNAVNRQKREATLLQYRVVDGNQDDCKMVGGWDKDQSLEELLLLGWEAYNWVCRNPEKPDIVRNFRSRMKTYDYDMVVVCKQDKNMPNRQLVTIYPNSAEYVPQKCGPCAR